MDLKLIATEQAAKLCKGNMIKRSRLKAVPDGSFDQACEKDISTYEIRSINSDTLVIELMQVDSSLKMLSSPSDIRRLFIRSADMIKEEMWWI